MTEALTETVRGKGRPFFGICVGMQLMATRGYIEYETSPGLDWIAGDVTAIEPIPALKIPHMGWNASPATGPPGARRDPRRGRTGSTPISSIPMRSSLPT